MSLSMSETEARRLLGLEVVGPERTFAPDRAKRILTALGMLGRVALARDPGGHEWAVVVVNDNIPKIVYSMTLDGD